MKKNTTQSETYAVYYLFDSGKQPKDIAKELDIGLKTVKDIISLRPVMRNDKIETTSAKTTTKTIDVDPNT